MIIHERFFGVNMRLLFYVTFVFSFSKIMTKKETTFRKTRFHKMKFSESIYSFCACSFLKSCLISYTKVNERFYAVTQTFYVTKYACDKTV